MTDTAQTPDDRLAWPAIRDGLRRRCPNCQKAPLFQSYLKAVDHCANCNEAYHHHRADDGPAYIVILIVAHVLGLMFHLLFEPLGRDPVLMISVLIPLSLGMCLFMLPRVKGGLIAVQWAKRMHGFGSSARD